MSFFDGESSHPADSKGRVSLPSRFRKMLPDELVLVLSPDESFPSVYIYSEEAYAKWANSLIQSMGGLPENLGSSQHVLREIFGRVRRVSVDQAGRILIPAELRQAASLGKTVKIIGVFDRIEIWNEEIHKKSKVAYQEFKLFADSLPKTLG